MKQGFVKSQKLEKWLKWMQVIHDEIQLLVWEAKMFWEVQDIIRQNPRIQNPNPFYRYLGRSYVSHTLAGLRRQIKPQKDSISSLMSKVCAFISSEGSHHKGLTSSLAQSLYMSLYLL